MKMKWRAEITAEEQLPEVLATDKFDYIYAPMEFLGGDITAISHRSRVIAVPPVFLGGDEPIIAENLRKLRETGFKSALAHTLGHIELIKSAGLSVHGGFRLNITNSLALKKYEELGLTDGIFSVELSLTGVGKIKSGIPMGIMAYGKLPLMVMRRCPVRDDKLCVGCDPCVGNGCNSLTDRLGNKLQTLCRMGETEILNPVPIALSDRADNINADFMVLRFSPGENIGEIVRIYERGLPFTGKFTRGLYYKRV